MNRCTLIVDGNWLLMSRLFSMQQYFSNLNDASEKELGKKMLKEQMLRSINLVCNTFNCIDNIILVADGGSWRKNLERPISVGTEYKANRKHDEDYDWFAIFSCIHELVETFKFNGVTASCSPEIEGDDWISYWSKRLNKQGTNCLIWSTDCDLKQLISNETNSFTAWYNHKSGLWLDESFNSGEIDFMADILNPEKNMVLNSLKKAVNKIEYINPQEIVISKIISGDSSDNIKPVAQKVGATRTYGISEREFGKIRENYKITCEEEIDTVDKLMANKEYIAERICELNKYKEQNCVEDVIERIEFNRILVELNPEFMPVELNAVCEDEEYKEYDINSFKNNYSVLLGEKPSDEIQNIITELPF